MWLRTQEPANADQSGWRSAQDARRRVLHYRYRFDLERLGMGVCLALTDLYLYHSVAYPKAELVMHHEVVENALARGGWRHNATGVWARGDLRCTVVAHETHPQDVRLDRKLSPRYAALDVWVISTGFAADPATRNLPWEVLAGGMRVIDRRGNPIEIADLAALADYLPFQTEVGCGMSIEAGIPPLHRLHEIYRVTNGTSGTFVLDPVQDVFLPDLLTEPEGVLPELTEMFRACFLAEPTPAHNALRALADAGHLVGPVITNNFDGLAARSGLDEWYVRRYDQRVPFVPFVPHSRSLLVVGSHADRRKVQARARARGMRLFFADPEGFWKGDKFIDYPVEGAMDDDFLCRREASVVLPHLATILGVPV